MVSPPEAEQDGPSAMDVSEKEDDAASQGSWDIAAQYQPLPYITQHVGRLNIVSTRWGKHGGLVCADVSNLSCSVLHLVAMEITPHQVVQHPSCAHGKEKSEKGWCLYLGAVHAPRPLCC